MALWVPESKFRDHFYRPKPPPKPPKRHLRNPNRTSKSDFWPFFYFGHFPIEIPIEVEKMLGRAFQTCNLKNKNCSELLRTKGMGLDRAPSNFLTLVFLDPPTAHIHQSIQICLYILTPPDTTRHASDTTRHHQTCSRHHQTPPDTHQTISDRLSVVLC